MDGTVKTPQGKTEAFVTQDIHQTPFRREDFGYIDGYVTAADDRPYAVFVRASDGKVDLVATHQLLAVTAL